MAAKVNTKFVMFLVIALVMAVGVLGGLYVLSVRGDAERRVRLGDEAFAQGDLERARDYYGRAVHKEPANQQYLAKYEQATLAMVPKTRDQALELYNSYIGILKHATRHGGANADVHLRLLREVYSGARRGTQQWEFLAECAKDMWQALPEGDPARPLAKVYEAAATFRRSGVATDVQLTEAEAAMESAVQSLPDNDLAWATLVMGNMVIAEKMMNQGRTPEAIQAQWEKADRHFASALEKVPNGPETARLYLLRQMIRYTEDPQATPVEQIDQACERLVSSISNDADPGIVVESAGLLALHSRKGLEMSIALLERYLQANARVDDVRFNLANLLLQQGELDRAEQTASEIIAAEPLTVSFLAQLQPELRKRSASLLVDIETLRWERATAEERAARMQAITQARNKLLEYISDPSKDVLAIRADAKLAYANEDYARAVSLFERVVKETTPNTDVETLHYSAFCLEKVNQLGTAHERISEALKKRPGAAGLVLTKARLEVAMGRKTQAAATLEALANSQAAGHEEARQMLTAITAMGEGGAAPSSADPVIAAIQRADAAVAKGDLDEARNILTAMLGEAPDHVGLLYSLALTEMRAGQTEQARQHAQRALTLQPDNRNLKQLVGLLTHEDPLAAMLAFHNQEYTGDVDQLVALMVGLKVMHLQQTALASQLEAASDAEKAAKAQSLATRAKTELDRVMAEVEKASPNHPVLLEYQLEAHLQQRNWTAAEQVVSRATAADADNAGGLLFRGRFHLERAVRLANDGKNQDSRTAFQEAVRSLESAVERMSYSATAWRNLALAHQGMGNFAQAERAYEQAYKCNPNDLNVVRSYVALLLQGGEQMRARDILATAHELAPNDAQIRHNWLMLESEVGDRTRALRLRRQMYAENPDDSQNAAELARLLGTMAIDRDVILDGNGQPLYGEQRWVRMTGEERARIIAQARAEMHQQADGILNKLAEQRGDDLSIASLRANLLRARGDVDGGERVLREFIARQAGAASAAMYIELARYQIRSNYNTRATETLKQALALQDDKVRQVDHELGQHFMRNGDFANAYEHLAKVAEVSHDRGVRNQMIECLVKVKRFDDADRLLDEVIRDGGEDMIALLLTASIAEARGDDLLQQQDAPGAERKYAQQRDALLRAEALMPTSPTPRLILAQSLLREFERTGNQSLLNDALQALDRAEKARSGLADTSVARVAVLKAMGNTGGAIGELRRLLDRQPDHAAARRELVQLYLSSNQVDSALVAIDEAIATNPTVAMWHELKGDVLRLNKSDAAGAYAAYVQACDLAPTDALLYKIGEAVFASGSSQCRELVTRLASHAQLMERSPVLREMHARALDCIGRRPQALEELRTAYSRRKEMIKAGEMGSQEIAAWFQTVVMLFPSTEQANTVDASSAEQFVLTACGGSPDANELRGLGKIWQLSRDPKLTRTLEFYKKAVDACPADQAELLTAIQVEYATYLMLVGSYAEASAEYEKVLQRDPRHSIALNNQAYLLAEVVKDPQRALPYAQRALELTPRDAAVLDTVGWVYHLTGDNEKATQFLRESIEQQKSLTAYIHIAEVLLKTRDLAGAQDALEEARRLRPDSQTLQKIQSLEDDIRKAREAG